MRKMKKSLWFIPLALDYYITVFVMIVMAIISGLFPPEAKNIITGVVNNVWFLYQTFGKRLRE